MPILDYKIPDVSIRKRLGRQVQENSALIAGRVNFLQDIKGWDVARITRFEDKVYCITGIIIEGVPNFHIIVHI